ncbi:FtsX-like permease family protein [Hymenobacter lutimineralis]|uniref:FtsX-like permease family protein n=1 Tax=Hymenobacter lutimineralis TaxID=2606448 RepID=A0A5D6V6M9_9BACT|nr:FtsX-like permease family protein [Hymenobacter lutimineralis]TYZ10578.1 FtsX-like permease family protein [Hymenobacter lutimineralis]
MFRHLFRLIWNRKRTNVLLLSEIFFSFVVLFGVATIFIGIGTNYVLPRGFAHEQVWRLNIAAGQGEKMPRPQLDDVLRQVRALPGVQDLTLTSQNTPFRFITMNSDFVAGKNKAVDVDRYDADDHYAATMGLQLKEGRWFQPSDDAATHRAAVITRNMRETLFGTQPAIGQLVRQDPRFEQGPQEAFQVVGVVEDVRPHGDFDGRAPSMWMRLQPHDTTSWEGAAVLVRVAPGQGAELQQKIVHTVAGVTRKWSTQVYALEADRLDKLKITVAPLAALAVVGLFLIVNVALGLFGVLWYNINQRRAEVGLRRALGATGSRISAQFLSEMLVLTTLGVALGLLLAAQFPLLQAFDVPTNVYLLGMLIATGLIFLLTAVCAWQPSRLAARIQPAVALREE